MHSAKVLLLTTFGACALIASTGQTFPKENLRKHKARIIDSEQMIFSSGGVIEIQDSFGQVKVEGWDLPEVELTVVKATQKAYAPAEMPGAVAELDRILVGTERPTDNHLIITTSFPSRKPTRLLRGKANVEMEYRIRAPRQTRVIIRHDIGDVEVNNIAGDVKVTTKVGEISLHVPSNARFALDAKARLGDVCSELGAPDGPAYELYLRVGVGDITVHKLTALEPATTVD
jgi:hypothetical protein